MRGPAGRTHQASVSTRDLSRDEVAGPDALEHRRADPLAEGAGQPPREPQLLGPGEVGAAPGRRREREPAGAGDDARVAHPHRPLRVPLGDLHHVGESDRTDLRVALERGALARGLLGPEPDGLGVGHPLDVGGDVAEVVPDLRRRGVQVGGHRDRRHAGSRPAGVHRDVGVVVGAERAAVPARPPLDETEPGVGGEGVELVGCRPADAPGAQPDARLGDVHVLTGQLLGGRVAAAHAQDDLVGGDGPGLDPAAGVQGIVVGHERLDRHAAAGLEVVGDGAQAAALVLDVDEVEERVVRHERRGEAPVAERRVGHVAEDRLDALAARLGAEALQHGRGGVDPGDLDPRLGEGDGEPAGADAELEDRPAAGQLDEGLHAGVDVAEVGVPVVVHVGEPLAVGRRVVALHPVSVAGRRRVAPVAPAGRRDECTRTEASRRFVGSRSMSTPTELLVALGEKRGDQVALITGLLGAANSRDLKDVQVTDDVFDALVAGLGHQDSRVRWWSVQLLDHCPDPRAIVGDRTAPARSGPTSSPQRRPRPRLRALQAGLERRAARRRARRARADGRRRRERQGPPAGPAVARLPPPGLTARRPSRRFSGPERCRSGDGSRRDR